MTNVKKQVWTRENRDRIRAGQVLKSARGVACAYAQLTAAVGVKFYADKAERDEALRLQEKHAEHGTAPESYGKVSLRRRDILALAARPRAWSRWKPSDDEYVYGYLTEVARVTGDWPDKELFDRLGQHGGSAVDMHCANWGYVKRGGKEVAVRIDFDPAHT